MTQARLQDIAIEYLEFLELKESGEEGHWAVATGAPELLRELIREIHGASKHDEWTMQFIFDSLTAIAESEKNDYLLYIEPDGYANQLTNWLGSHDNRLDFVTAALRNESFSDGFLLLQKAQYLEKKSVLEAVQAIIERQSSLA